MGIGGWIGASRELRKQCDVGADAPAPAGPVSRSPMSPPRRPNRTTRRRAYNLTLHSRVRGRRVYERGDITPDRLRRGSREDALGRCG